MMRRGQVALYLLMTIVVLAIVCFMNVDIFLAVRAKNRVQNAGDAAALAAARVQGEILNRIGRLNIEHLVAAAYDRSELCRSIELEQKRLALLGPVRALKKANEAALANGAEPRKDFSKLLEEHLVTIRTVYAGGTDSNGDPYPEPWTNAWVDYASEIEQAMAGGLAIGPDNNEYYNAQGGHLLLNPDFYSAVAGRCWCWFHFNAENALRNYGGWSSWGALPERKTNSAGNCELFSLHVEARTGALTETFSLKEIAALASQWQDEPVTEKMLAESREIANPESVWFFFESSAWGQWFNGLRLVGEEDSDAGDFPLVGEVKRAYNVRGAAAVCRSIMTAPGITDDDETEVTWSAAAKPFGKIADAAAGDQPVTAQKSFVLPVFEAVRLIPLDTATLGALGTADIGWVHHVRKHLPAYLQNGPDSHNGCYYCSCLVDWERPTFHQTGSRWLDLNANTCVRSTGGSHCSHGGAHHGH